MAGVPGLTPAQREAVKTPLATARDTGRSALGAIGQFADKAGFGSDRRRSRVLAGFASQWYGLDEQGNPALGETPGIVSEAKSLGSMPAMLMRATQDMVAKKLGISTDDPYYKLTQQLLLADPEFAAEATERADRIHQAVREDMGLAAPHGVEQNMQESMGVMLGQLPIPGGTIAHGAQEANPTLLKRLGAATEWFTPTVRPTLGNYTTGAVTGGALSTLADGPEESHLPVVLPDKDQPGLSDVRPIYPDGQVGYSGSKEDQEELQQLLAQEKLAPAKLADGGKVSAFRKMLQSRLGEGAAMVGPNARSYVDTVERLGAKFPKRMSSLKLLNDFTDGQVWEFEPHQNRNLLRLIDKYAIEIPEDVPLYRGVSGENPDGRRMPKLDWKPGQGYKTTGLPVLSMTQSKPTAIDYALQSDSDRNAVLNINRDKPVRAFPMVTTGFEEWLAPSANSRFSVKGVNRKNPDYLDVDVDYTQMEKFASGGSVKDLCSGGMSALQGMRAKYANGGKVNTLKAIKDAIAHLDNGDTASALRTLHASPGALRDPNIAAAVQKLKMPQTAAAGRQVLDSHAAVDANAKVEATFAKGGKVKGLSDLVKGGPLGKPFNWDTAARRKVKSAHAAWEKAGGHKNESLDAFTKRLSGELGAPEEDVQNTIYELYR